jgi:hypothetical protein
MNQHEIEIQQLKLKIYELEEHLKKYTNRKGCINRDKNGCKNIQKVFNSYIQTGERPERYRREYKLQ